MEKYNNILAFATGHSNEFFNESEEIKSIIFDSYTKGAISEAAKEYWQSQQTIDNVDFDALRKIIYNEVNNPIDVLKIHTNNLTDKVLEAIKSHLAIKHQNNAIEFAEWLYMDGCNISLSLCLVTSQRLRILEMAYQKFIDKKNGNKKDKIS